jgi:hypothetical protein
VYLYGSGSRGETRQGSDLDLAVSVSPRGTLLDDAGLHDELIAALGRKDVDLLVLEDVPLWLQVRAVEAPSCSAGTSPPGSPSGSGWRRSPSTSGPSTRAT